MNQYVFENIADQAPDRFTVLEECYDPVSRAQLMRTGVGQDGGAWKSEAAGARWAPGWRMRSAVRDRSL